MHVILFQYLYPTRSDHNEGLLCEIFHGDRYVRISIDIFFLSYKFQFLFTMVCGFNNNAFSLSQLFTVLRVEAILLAWRHSQLCVVLGWMLAITSDAVPCSTQLHKAKQIVLKSFSSTVQILIARMTREERKSSKCIQLNKLYNKSKLNLPTLI